MPTPKGVENLTSSDFEVKVRKPKILFFDIEVSALKTRSWSMYKANAIKLDESFRILCWSAKWQGGKHITKGMPDYEYEPGSLDDKHVTQGLWELLNQADVVIGHNVQRFDLRKFNTRAVLHGLRPFEPVKVVDTLKLARQKFAFPSNRLDSLGDILGLGRKTSIGGFDLWEQCEQGNLAAWRKMKAYCKQDVVLLEKVYDKLVSYSSTHPNLAALQDVEGCHVCKSTHIQRRGWTPTPNGTRRRKQCIDCGFWFLGEYKKVGQ